MTRRAAILPHPQSETETPFWISYADLMTALMVLFLTTMAVAVHAVNAAGAVKARGEQTRAGEISTCLNGVRGATGGFAEVTLTGNSINFGSRANFAFNRNDLTPEQVAVLRKLVPRVLTIAAQDACSAWLKRVVVDGFASKEGSYLNNLNLSMQRSERVLCSLLSQRGADPLTTDERQMIQRLFFVGGSSSNSLKQSQAESRRIEMRLEFYDLKEPKENSPKENSNDEMALDTTSTCPIDER